MFKITELFEKDLETKSITYETHDPDLHSGESFIYGTLGWVLVLREVEKVLAE